MRLYSGKLGITLGVGALAMGTWACAGSSGSGDAGLGGGSSGSSGSTSSGGSTSSSGSSSGSAGSGGSSGASGSSSGGSTSSGSGSGAVSSGGGGDSGVADSGRTTSDGGGTPYPSGPYCADAGAGGSLSPGCVLKNFQWIGYSNPAADAVSTTKQYLPYSLDDARKSGKHYLMINIAETFCPGCAQSATDLGSGAQAVVQAGGLVVEVLMTTGFTTIASKTDLDNWVNKYALHNSAMKDPDGSTGTPTNTALGRRDQAYIVDLTTMKILQYINGSIGQTSGSNSGVLGLAAMRKLLGI